MKPPAFSRVPALLLFLFGCLPATIRDSSAQSIQFTNVLATNLAVQFQVRAPTNAYYRIESSPDLQTWLPVDFYLGTNAAHTTSDSLSTNAAQFYRALQVDPGVEIIDYGPGPVRPGDQLEIYGQFLPPLGQYTIQIGGLNAKLLSGTSTRLFVTVPANAATGLITVSNSNGTVLSHQAVVVMSNAVLRLQPPSGISLSNFTVENNYGDGVLVSGTASDFSIPVRQGYPTLSFAFVPGQESNLFFCTITFGGGPPVNIDAASTAAALVFQNWNLFTTDPYLAPSMMAIIQTNAAVQAFGQALATAMAQSPTPYQTPEVTNSYQAAIISVLTNKSFSTLAAAAASQAQLAVAAARERSPKSLSSQGLNSKSFVVYDVRNPPLDALSIPASAVGLSGTGRYLELTYKGLNFNMTAKDYLFNPVDWIVDFQSLDVDASFPAGRPAFDKVWDNIEITPQTYVTNNAFFAQRSVSANLVSSGFDVVGSLSKYVVGLVVPKVDSSVPIPPGDAIYAVRAVGPSFRTAEDFKFVRNEMRAEYVESLTVNLANVVFTVIGMMTDDKNLDKSALKRADEIKSIILSVIQQGPIQSVEDFNRVALTILQSVIKDYLKNQVKNAAKSAIVFVESNSLKVADEILKSISTLGVLEERRKGFFSTTSLETSFIVVGDPFSLKNLTVAPSTVSPGQTVTVTFQSSRNLQPFKPGSLTDLVTFEGNGFFNGQVQSVSGPDASGIQTLKVLIPLSLSTTHDGAYTMIVNTQGRSGRAPFKVSTGAALSTVTPLQGFPPTTNFNGLPYAGTPVRLQGAVFTSKDIFQFAGGTIATNVQPNTLTPGDVTVKVPVGALTGPLKIEHNTPNGNLEIPGPVFTVLGPPVITSVDPPGGAPAGDILRLTVSQAGNDPNLILAQFTGAPAQFVNVLADGSLLVLLPIGAQSGSLTVFTPAGSNQVPYNVYASAAPTNLLTGASITVGTNTHISLSDAIGFANKTLLPTFEQAKAGISTYFLDTNNPAAWKLGPSYIDTIIGNSTDDATVSMNFDIMNGTFTGKLAVTGNSNSMSGIYGVLLVSGDGNRLGGTLNGAVTISGKHCGLGGFFHGPVVISGDENSIVGATFQNVAGDALTITGNYNSVGYFNTPGSYANSGGANFLTNLGDGLVINGGLGNLIGVNKSVGNTGNGVTLTGGAQDNSLWIFTGASSNQVVGVPGTGNKGHGIALIGDASGNMVSGIQTGVSGNGLDGIYMEGPGVTLNSFRVNSTANGRNGVTITNGPSMNSIGSTDNFVPPRPLRINVDYNGGSGVVCANCGPNPIYVLAQKNGLYGVLLSNAKPVQGGFPIDVYSQAVGSITSPQHISGNGRAGLRLENGTTGVQGSAILGDGLELDGPTVSGNTLFCVILGAKGNGAFIGGGANNNDITLGVSGSGADGILLQGASENFLQVFSSSSNAMNGIHITSKSFGNWIAAPALAPSYAGASVGNYVVSNLLNGCLVDSGSSFNLLDALNLAQNSQDGLGFSGTEVTGNEFINSFAQANGRYGIRFDSGASGNVVGEDTNSTTRVQINDNFAAGISISDPATADNLIQGVAFSGELFGILADNGAGIGQIVQSTFNQSYNGVVLRDGAHDGVLTGLTIQSSTNAAVVISDSYNILIGGNDPASTNQFLSNPTGIEISGNSASNNVIKNNLISTPILTPGDNAVYIHDNASQNAIVEGNLFTGYLCGVRIEGASNNVVNNTTIQNNQNQGAGIIISSGATANIIDGNIIQLNEVGVLVSDEGTVGNTITGNSITANAVKGIQLSAGGNNQIAPPTLPPYAGLTVHGSSSAPDGSIVEIFWDTGDEGKTFIGGGPVLSGHFTVVLETDPTTLGLPLLNATVTDPDGNTSEFSGQAPNLTLQNLAFTVPSATGPRQVYYSADGANPVNLTRHWNSANDNFSPALPGGVSCDKLLFVSLRTGNREIFAMEPNTNAIPQQVTTNLAGNFDPTWLTPCRRFVFVSQRDGNSQIYAVNLDGTSLQRLTTNSVADISPAPFLNGTRIVFVSNRGGSNALWIMNADGSNQTAVGGVAGIPSQPAVSSDGVTVALAVTQNGASEIAIVRTDGTGFARLTSDGTHATHPTWLADGKHLVFSSDRNGSTNLYTIDRFGAGLQALPFSPDSGSEPSAGGR